MSQINPYEQYGTDIIQVANQFSGGGYNWGSGNSGTCIDLKFNGKTLLSKGSGSYCCGYTLSIAFIVATNRLLFSDKTVNQIKKFNGEWYSSGGIYGKLCIDALVNLGIGAEISLEDAKAGDFVQIWRKDGSGHSVIFIDHIKKNGKIVGFNYRSSQGGTGGIGNSREYFAGNGGNVVRDKTYFGRMNLGSQSNNPVNSNNRPVTQKPIDQLNNTSPTITNQQPNIPSGNSNNIITISGEQPVNNADWDLVHGILGSNRIDDDLEKRVTDALQRGEFRVSDVKISSFKQVDKIITTGSVTLTNLTPGQKPHKHFTTRGSIGGSYEQRHDQQVSGLSDRLKNNYKGEVQVFGPFIVEVKDTGVFYKQSFFAIEGVGSSATPTQGVTTPNVPTPPVQNNNPTEPIPQEKKEADTETPKTNAGSTSNQIKKIFSNTLKPKPIEITFEGVNQGNQQIIAQTLGFTPTLFYNGSMIDAKDVKRFRLLHEDIVPKIEATVLDTYGIFKKTGMPKDDTKISLFLNSRSKYLKSIRIDFKIIDFYESSSSSYVINGVIDVPKLYTKNYASVPAQTSFSTLQQIAKECGLGFITNITDTLDAQTWVNTGLTYREFIKKIVDKSYINDQSFQVCYIDYYYNLVFMDLSSEFKRDIKNDLAVSATGFDQMTAGTGKTDVDDRIEPLIFTTDRNLNANNFFIEKFVETNNSTAISVSEGYRSEVKYLDPQKKEIVYFKVESQTEDASKTIVPKANSGDDTFYKENTKSIYSGKIDSENTHINAGYASVNNKRNLLELIKLGAIATIPRYNFNLYPFRKVPIQVVLPAPTPDQPQGFDTRLSGEWLISGLEWILNSKGTKTVMKLVKRDYSLSPEETTEPEIKKEQNNKKTEKNEVVPGQGSSGEKPSTKVETKDPTNVPTGTVVRDSNGNLVNNPDKECFGASHNTLNEKYPRSVKWGGKQPQVIGITNPPSYKVNLSAQRTVPFVTTNVTAAQFVGAAWRIIAKLNPAFTSPSKGSITEKRLLLILYSAYAKSRVEQSGSDGFEFRGFNNNISGVESSGFSVYSASDIQGKVSAKEGGTSAGYKFYYAFTKLESGLIPPISKIMERNIWDLDGDPFKADYSKTGGGQWAWRYYRDWNGFGGRTFTDYKNGTLDDCDLLNGSVRTYRDAVNKVNKVLGVGGKITAGLISINSSQIA